MAYGPLALSTLTPQDIVPPGSPSLTVIQESNTKIRVDVELPTQDSDGTSLSGLYMLSIGLRLRNSDGTNPFSGSTGEQIAAIAANGGSHKFVDLAPEDAGTTKSLLFDIIELEKEHVFAASVDDSVA